MFDLISFIRQYLPPSWRGDKTVGLMRVLFGSMLTTFIALDRLRTAVLIQARASGQLAVLERLCSDLAGTPIYLLEANGLAVDFQVVVPPTLSSDKVSAIRGIVAAYKQRGKRFSVSTTPNYLLPETEPLAWTAGYPLRSNGRIRWAIKSAGSYQTQVYKNSTLIFDQSLTYVAGQEQSVAEDDIFASYTVTIGGLTSTLAGVSLKYIGVKINAGTNPTISVYVDADFGGRATVAVLVRQSDNAEKSADVLNENGGYEEPDLFTGKLPGALIVGWGVGTYKLRLSCAGIGLVYQSEAFTLNTFLDVYGGGVVETLTLGRITIQTSDVNRWALANSGGGSSAPVVQFRVRSTADNAVDTGWQDAQAYDSTDGGLSYNYRFGFASLPNNKAYRLYARLKAKTSVALDQLFTLGTVVEPPVDPGDGMVEHPEGYGAPAGQDYQGHPFVTAPAPTYVFSRRSQPRPYGVQYPYAEQTAKGVALFDRLPPFTSDTELHIWGPWYNSVARNATLFVRSVTSVNGFPLWRDDTIVGDVPWNWARLAYEKKLFFINDDFMQAMAQQLKASMDANGQTGDSKYSPIQQYAANKTMVSHEAAWRAMGAQAYGNNLTDGVLIPGHESKGDKYLVVDLESTLQYDNNQRNCIGWFLKGYLASAVAAGRTAIAITYAQSTFAVQAVDLSYINTSTGLPEFCDPDKDFLQNDPTMQALNDMHGFVSCDGYLQAIAGEHDDIVKRNPDRSIQMSSGLPVFNDLTTTTAFGQSIDLEPNEAFYCVRGLYRQANRGFAMHYFMQGGYPGLNTIRRSHLTNVRLSFWTRYTNEGVLETVRNDRPIPQWLQIVWNSMCHFLSAGGNVTAFGSDFNTVPRAPGGSTTGNDNPQNVAGTAEAILVAAHQNSANAPYRTGRCKLVFFTLGIKNKNLEVGERYTDKPIAFGKIWEMSDGTCAFEDWLHFTLLDDEPRVYTIWSDNGTIQSPGYKVTLRNGRTYHSDCWDWDSRFTFNSLQPEHLFIQGDDALHVERTWQGDWRLNTDTAGGSLVPPDEPELP